MQNKKNKPNSKNTTKNKHIKIQTKNITHNKTATNKNTIKINTYK